MNSNINNPNGMYVNNNIRFPAGTVITFCKVDNIPTGWLECNGDAISRTVYSDLFSVIGTTFGVGDGSTTFNLPDLRGEFIRGYDHGKGTDSGRVFASSQSDDNKSHDHVISGLANSAGFGLQAGGAFVSEALISRYNQSTTSVGTESRPKNIALMFIIKI